MTPMLTVQQVAERLNVGHGRVRRLIAQGQLVASRVGGSWRIAETDLAAFLAAGRNRQASAPAPASDIPMPSVRRFA